MLHRIGRVEKQGNRKARCPALYTKNPLDRVVVIECRRESVDRIRGNRNDSAVTENLDRVIHAAVKRLRDWNDR